MTSLSEVAEAAPSIGHNNPPLTLPERLLKDYASIAASVDAIAAQANAAPKDVADDEQLNSIGVIVVAARNAWKSTDTKRTIEKAPHLEAERQVDAFFQPHLARLKRIQEGLEGRATIYNNKKIEKDRQERAAEAQRVAAEAERLRVQAEQSIAAGRVDDAKADLVDVVAAEQTAHFAAAATQVKAADVTRVRGGGGVLATSKSELTFEVEDYDKIPLDKLRPYLDRAAIDKAIRAYLKVAKKTAALAGVRFFEDTKAQFR